MQQNESDHDRIIRMDENIKWLMNQFGNHLQHHWAITVLAIGAAFTACSSLLMMVLSKLFR
jgi:hypothetical protein